MSTKNCAHTKIFMDRCQSLWVKRYWMNKKSPAKPGGKRKGLFISVGATRGKKLFDGALLTVRYFFDAIDTTLSRSLLCRGMDFIGDAQKQATCLEEAFQAGQDIIRA